MWAKHWTGCLCPQHERIFVVRLGLCHDGLVGSVITREVSAEAGMK
jgi:hypothetical protein